MIELINEQHLISSREFYCNSTIDQVCVWLLATEEEEEGRGQSNMESEVIPN